MRNPNAPWEIRNDAARKRWIETGRKPYVADAESMAIATGFPASVWLDQCRSIREAIREYRTRYPRR